MVEIADGLDFLTLLGWGSVEMSGVEACLRDAFRLGAFVVDDLEGTVGASLGAGRVLSSEDSESTGVPCLKEVFSVSLLEEGSKEESISSTTLVKTVWQDEMWIGKQFGLIFWLAW